MPGSLKFILSVTVLMATAARADIGDDFKAYLDKVLPQSHEIAKQSARLIERTVIQSGISLAQSHLDLASRDVVQLNAQLVKLEDPEFFNEDLADPVKLVSQLSVLSQMENFINRINSRVENFSAILGGLGPHCEEPAAFANYNIDTLNISFTVPNHNVFTGVKVGFVIGDDGSVKSKPLGQGGGVEDIPLVGPIVSFIKNQDIKGSIEKQADRIRREQPTTETYRTYALEICRSLSAEAVKQVQPYKELAGSLKNFSAVVPIEKLVSLKGYIRKQLAQFERAQGEALTAEVKGAAGRWLKPKEEGLMQVRLGIEANERLVKNALLLKTVECGKAAALLEELLSDISLSETYELKNRERLVPEVKNGIQARKKKCPEETL